jgi:hypothetical protein
MFDSGISVKSFIDDIKAEADIAPDITDTKYISWINALEQVLYSDIIREQRKVDIEVLNSEGEYIDKVEIKKDENEADVRFEDIISVFKGDTQLIKTSLLSGGIFNDCWFNNGGVLWVNTTLTSEDKKITVFYHVRPAEKSSANEEVINLPAEFMDLMYSYVRAEAYKYANEDALSAKWQAEYNARLEIFKAWVDARRPSFGM